MKKFMKISMLLVTATVLYHVIASGRRAARKEGRYGNLRSE